MIRGRRPGCLCPLLLLLLVLAPDAGRAQGPPADAAPAPTTQGGAAAPPASRPPFGVHVPPVPVTASAQWGEGIRLRAGDLFSLQIRSRAQIQAIVATPDASAVAAGASDEITAGFLVRRMRLVFAGHAFTKRLQYYIQLGLSPRDMEPDLLIPLRDVYITWQPLRDLGIRFGQMKVPFGKQRVVSSSALQLVDRSITVQELNLDRDVGLYLLSEDLFGLGGRLQYQAGVFTGRGRNRGPARDGILYVVRVQVNPFGDFDDLSEGDHGRRERPRLSLGAAVVQNFNTNRARSTHGEVYEFARFSFLQAAADLHFKWRGLSLISEVLYRASDEPAVMDPATGRTEYARPALGYYAQGGYLFPLPFEVVARWGEIYPLGAADPSFRHQREAGGGLNFYFYEHSLKLQGDYFYLFGEDARATTHQLRVQAQLYF